MVLRTNKTGRQRMVVVKTMEMKMKMKMKMKVIIGDIKEQCMKMALSGITFAVIVLL
ncbi:hypothetical protein TIFTF001_052283 [Ficus carica]|uniref:Uncharacterized protein n=1 Tax=Ficus carica TaxID=3494 RepID=A0AA88JGS5_FICCA|nr:hypothetical protein TIFTF001_052283 [Ficus carica]